MESRRIIRYGAWNPGKQLGSEPGIQVEILVLSLESRQGVRFGAGIQAAVSSHLDSRLDVQIHSWIPGAEDNLHEMCTTKQPCLESISEFLAWI